MRAAFQHLPRNSRELGGIVAVFDARTARTRYLAAVVPAFNHGVQRGLGRELIGDVLAPAWDVATVESIELPMYHFWEFATAVADDIESMAERLHGPEHAPPTLGRRRIFAAAAHPDVPPLPEEARAITMFGALRPTGPAATPLPPQPPQLTTRLADVVGRRDTPELPPPLYGEWAADRARAPADRGRLVRRAQPHGRAPHRLWTRRRGRAAQPGDLRRRRVAAGRADP